MSYLNSTEKLTLVKNLLEKHNISSYEIGKNTDISSIAVDNIKNGTTKNPREKTLNQILTYIEDKIVGTEIRGEFTKNFTDLDTQHSKVMLKLNQLINGQAMLANGIADTLLNTTAILDNQDEHETAMLRLENLITRKSRA